MKQNYFTSHIYSDSRLVEKSGVFIAIKGHASDGHDYIKQAIENGAKTVILEDKSKIIREYENKVNFVLVPDTRVALAEILSKQYKQPENIVAVTGTNGKTSTVNFFTQIIGLMGHNCASVGTMGIKDNRELFDSRKEFHNLTTPDPIILHRAMEELVANKINYMAIEASSHGLDQHRVDGLNIKAAAFTNFSQDHLDYHGSMEKYFEAKLKLFTEVLKQGSYAILNADIPEYQRLIDVCEVRKHKIISFGRKGDFIKIKNINYSNGLECNLNIDGKSFSFSTNLLGEFQIYNIVTAVGLVLSLGFSEDKAASVLSELKTIRGRLERVKDSEIFVDFSHTPDALEKALQVMRQHLQGDLIVVFGCGGDRDKTKRPLMGKVAERFADKIYVTDDNPRTENPKIIRQEVLTGCPGAYEVDGRDKAIKLAISNMRRGDRLLIAGKGHEDYQIIGKVKYHFDDREVVEKYI